MGWLGDRVRNHGGVPTIGDYSQSQLKFLVCLRVSGRAHLKDIARREGVPTANLCAMFRKLESNGLVVRDVDDDDRRNVWYSVSAEGAKVADAALEFLKKRLGDFFRMMSPENADKMVSAMRQINGILNEVKEKWK
jgi:DNA-binding MarR family transcriptional regulator